MWWPETGLNRRRRPFQGRALPLSYLASVHTSVASLRVDSGVAGEVGASTHSRLQQLHQYTNSLFPRQTRPANPPHGASPCSTLEGIMRRPVCVLACLTLVALTAALQVQAPAQAPAGEARAAHAYLAAVHDGPLALHAFLDQFPKGADPHIHLSGAVYAESFIRAAGEDGLCVDPAALSFARPPCAPPLVPAAQVPANQA